MDTLTGQHPLPARPCPVKVRNRRRRRRRAARVLDTKHEAAETITQCVHCDGSQQLHSGRISQPHHVKWKTVKDCANSLARQLGLMQPFTAILHCTGQRCMSLHEGPHAVCRLTLCKRVQLLTLARRSLPSLERGRTREAWRTKKTRSRQAMRSVRADTKEATCGEGAGWNCDRYSDLSRQVNQSTMLFFAHMVV